MKNGGAAGEKRIEQASSFLNVLNPFSEASHDRLLKVWSEKIKAHSGHMQLPEKRQFHPVKLSETDRKSVV